MLSRERWIIEFNDEFQQTEHRNAYCQNMPILVESIQTSSALCLTMLLKSSRNDITTSADAAMLGRIANSAYDLHPIICQAMNRGKLCYSLFRAVVHHELQLRSMSML